MSIFATPTEIRIEFALTICIHEMSNCPHWIGDENGFLQDYVLKESIHETFSSSLIEKEGILEMTKEEQTQWFARNLSFNKILHRVAHECGENVEDFYDEGSFVDFIVIDVEVENT